MNKTLIKRMLAGAGAMTLAIGAASAAMASDTELALYGETKILDDPAMTPAGAKLKATLTLDWTGAKLDITQATGGVFDDSLLLECDDGNVSAKSDNGSTTWDADISAFCNFGVAGTQATGTIDDRP